MDQISFKNIQKIGETVYENERYIHVHDSKLTLRYDSNYIEFKHIPTLAEFDQAAAYLREYHLMRNQHHMKFYFPENEEISGELAHHLKEQGYEVGFMELYAIHPQQFTKVNGQASMIEIKEVTEEDLEIYMELQYEQEAVNGADFAKQKRQVHQDNFLSENVKQILAYYQKEPAGSLDLILTDTTIEIDGFNVREQFQKQGIGSMLQKYVMDVYKDKTVILVADGEDTPREMYRRQNYNCLGFQYEAQKC
ncbi:GNAT family N-acetyltransferase [Virgibacillus halodenitrificans]|uniref:GNAT family N-acetyltransferase n=1 Tax=Virgibacillus halodenitrificans TaxID=1482 RepID=A0ABR7VM05_VIRHA|nr:GNAT family N-acetyltransferase [Virgibacillus halodenitrificans]MBD1222944.1 GNAT family N-acetyltransferase [Virgibacillus halodenitrificans]